MRSENWLGGRWWLLLLSAHMLFLIRQKPRMLKDSTNIITGTIKITIRGLFLILIAVCSRRSSSIIISLSNGYEHLFVVIYQVYIQVS